MVAGRFSPVCSPSRAMSVNTSQRRPLLAQVSGQVARQDRRSALPAAHLYLPIARIQADARPAPRPSGPGLLRAFQAVQRPAFPGRRGLTPGSSAASMAFQRAQPAAKLHRHLVSAATRQNRRAAPCRLALSGWSKAPSRLTTCSHVQPASIQRRAAPAGSLRVLVWRFGSPSFRRTTCPPRRSMAGKR